MTGKYDEGLNWVDTHCYLSAIGSIINRLAYGNEIFEEHGQTIMEANREAMGLLNFSFTQFWFVDILAPRNDVFPIHSQMTYSLPSPVKYIPAWFPGVTFKRLAKRSSELSDYVRNKPWGIVLERVCTRSVLLSCILPKAPMQLTRPEGYEDCMASRGVEKVGPSGPLRDAIAIMYSGTYVTDGDARKSSRAL